MSIRAPRHHDRPWPATDRLAKAEMVVHQCDLHTERFIESVPVVPPRARILVRAKAKLALTVLNGDRSVKSVAAVYGTT